MKKDIEWLKEALKEKIDTMAKFEDVSYSIGLKEVYQHTLLLINQLDEPEVLSLEWIDEHKFNIDTYDEVINVDDLQNLLVPKQELPVIPKFVADWYEIEGKRSSWWNWFYKWGRDESRTELETKTIRWMQDFNEEIFVNMFLHGYEVEEEQKYYVILEENSYGAMGLGIDREGRLTFTATHDKWSLPKLTEQEIKDYDERYWPFAVKVEELG